MSRMRKTKSTRPQPNAVAPEEPTGEAAGELPVWPETVQGRSLIRNLERQVRKLREEDPHGNRELFLDDVVIAYLLAFFNPTLRTLRTIEDFSQTKQAQRSLSVRRICKSTLSDFNRLAEPERLEPLVTALRAELARRSGSGSGNSDLPGVLKQVIAVDGTFLPAMAEVAWAVCSRNQREGECYRARLDWHVNVHSWVPEVVVVPEPKQSESRSAAHAVTPGAIHVYDRGHCSFELLAAHFEDSASEWEARADFVLRLRVSGTNSPVFQVLEEAPLDDAARAAFIVSDRRGTLPGFDKQYGAGLVLREIVLQPPDDSHLRILTNLLDLPATLIALIYRLRWQIELFFRWLKCYANFDHLISTRREGVLLNFYVVVIGILLMALHTGSRPNKYLFVLLGLVANGGATLEDILPIWRERARQCERDRQSAARRRAKKGAQSR